MTKSLRIELVRMELFPGSIDLSKCQKVMSNVQNWLDTSITLFYFNRFGIWMLRKQTKAWDFGITKKPLTQSEQQGKEILNTLFLFFLIFCFLSSSWCAVSNDEVDGLQVFKWPQPRPSEAPRMPPCRRTSTGRRSFRSGKEWMELWLINVQQVVKRSLHWRSHVRSPATQFVWSWIQSSSTN